MGNEHSQLAGLEIDEKAIEVTDFWAHHAAYIEHSRNISVLVGEPIITGNLWLSQMPLEKAAKNLMIYRHPSILKYVSSWRRSSKYYLAVEDVKPLSHVLAQQDTLQICIGLFSILKALIFLHEKGYVSHNNIATSAIYVTKDGSWRLSGMEYLCSYKDLNSDYLNKIRTHRYSKSIDPNEERNIKNKEAALEFVDVYGFGVLAMEVLKKKSDDSLLAISSFTDLCKQHLLHINVNSRPKLRTLLEHPFFNHEFIAIHSFLIELPLKLEAESTAFFSTLVANLQTFDESIVASQLGTLLLSRMVLLNKTANTNVMPYLFTIKGELACTKGLFTEATFKKHIVPILLEVFCVRDAQIRLILLEYFKSYIHCFTNEELQSDILPELLVGIKDCNDHLVSVTLRALADLVQILGASVVIGGKRARLFNDGRPTQLLQHSHDNDSRGRLSDASRRGRPSSRRNSGGNQNNVTISTSGNARHLSITNSTIFPTTSDTANSSFTNLDTLLPERPSPDGEEDETTSTEELDPAPITGTSTSHNDDELEEEDNWDDWGNTTDDHLTNQLVQTVDTLSLNNYVDFSEDVGSDVDVSTSVNTNLRKSVSKRDIDDIFALDIKLQGAAMTAGGSSGIAGEVDFFEDMEPVIETTAKFVVDPLASGSSSSRLKVNMQQHSAAEGQDGWDVNEWD